MRLPSPTHTTPLSLLCAKLINSNDSVRTLSLRYTIYFGRVCIATEKAVATDDVYYCNEKGQILDIDFRKYKTFREGTLFSLLEVTPVDRRNRPVALSKQKAIMDGNVDEDEDEMVGRGSSLHKRDGTQVSS